MNFSRIVKDPYYTGIIHQIESVIYEVDQTAKDDGINLKDSEVKSILQKAIAIARGKRPSITETSEKEKRLKLMLLGILELAEDLSTDTDGDPVTRSDWIVSLRAIDSSLKTRREMYGHSRGYLDFLQGFLEKGDLS